MKPLPIYLLVDRSGSMAASAGTTTAIEIVTTVLRELMERLARDPAIRRVVRVCLISFAEDATLELPTTSLSSATAPPPLQARGRTSLAAAFELTAKVIVADRHALGGVRSPLVFILTDGRATARRDLQSGWGTEHEHLLTVLADDSRGLLVPYGYGQVDVEVLARLASGPAAVYVAAGSDSPADAIEGFAELVFGSVAISVARDTEDVVAPAGVVLAHDEEY